MSIRKVTSKLNDPTYVRALEKELKELRTLITSTVGRTTALEKRPRAFNPVARPRPATVTSLQISTVGGGVGATVTAVYPPVLFDTKGNPIEIDRHELQGGKQAEPGFGPIPAAGAHLWARLSSSTDGSRLVGGPMTAGGDSDYLYTSSDSGHSWIARTGPGVEYWNSTASSADGSTLYATGATVGLVRSADFGANWTSVSTPEVLDRVACSTDGQKLVGTSGGRIFRSPDGGGSWSMAHDDSTKAWNAIVLSADGGSILAGGTNQVADASSALISSGDFGSTWTQHQSSEPWYTGWISVALSADGATMLAVSSSPQRLFASYNSGANWSVIASSNTTTYKYINAVFCSNDGQVVLVNTDGVGGLSVSKDGGASFAELPNLNAYSLTPLALSGDGLLAFSYSGNDALLVGGTLIAGGRGIMSNLTAVDGATGTISYWPLPHGETWDFSVRAVSEAGVAGDWYELVPHTLA